MNCTSHPDISLGEVSEKRVTLEVIQHSRKSVIGIMSKTPLIFSQRKQSILIPSYIPDIICLLAFQLVSELPSSPRVCTIAADHILRMYSLTSTSLAIRMSFTQKFLGIIWCHVAPKEAIWLGGTICGTTLLWICLIFSEMLKSDFDGIGIIILSFRLIKSQRFGKDSTLDSDITVIFQRIEKESLNSA